MNGRLQCYLRPYVRARAGYFTNDHLPALEHPMLMSREEHTSIESMEQYTVLYLKISQLVNDWYRWLSTCP